MIQCQNIHKSFKNQPILKNLSFAVNAGEITGVIGRSGAGKTTLLRILGGLACPDQGHVKLMGQDLWPGPNRKLLQHVGTVFQSINLLSRRTVAQNVLLPREFCGGEGESAAHLLSLVGLEGFDQRYPAELSGGQRQRVAIARALSTGARILLCDEITSALDRETTYDVLAVLQNLRTKLGLTILMITHDMNVVREVCDTVHVLDSGVLVESAPVESVLLNPQHATTQSLLGHLSRQELPKHWAEKLGMSSEGHSQAILQIIFAGDAANRPLIADLVGQQGVPANIIAGHMDHVRETAFGSLIISVPVSENRLEKTLAYFAQCHVGTQILGYLP